MRLSVNWLVRTLALVFIEAVRNTPLLVQIVFWYFAVLQTLPPPRQSVVLPGGLLLNIRGLYLPTMFAAPNAEWLWACAMLLLLATPLAWRLQWRSRPVGRFALLLPVLALFVAALGIDHVSEPVMRGFNIADGVQVPPELVALWAGLSVYGSAFIAEIVRAAILSVQKGQREAALSLGLKPGQVLAKVVLPQALRVMVPPLTSQYLNIIKSSSLGSAVAYPELFQIFAGTVLNQSGREIETIVILMAIFLAINPRHRRVHELVQPPRGPGDALMSGSELVVAPPASAALPGRRVPPQAWPAWEWARKNLAGVTLERVADSRHAGGHSP